MQVSQWLKLATRRFVPRRWRECLLEVNVTQRRSNEQEAWITDCRLKVIKIKTGDYIDKAEELEIEMTLSEFSSFAERINAAHKRIKEMLGA